MNTKNSITGLNRKKDELTVQKSKNLMALSRSEMTLAEFKIMDAYLSRIDSHNPDNRTVVFEKKQIEQLLNVKRILPEELKHRLKHLMGTVVEISDSDEKEGFTLITLFSEAIAEKEDDGLWKIKLECTDKAMKYIFNIENLGYLKYKLRNIVDLRSRYFYLLYLYLEDNRYRKSWVVELDELKKLLRCETDEIYKEYKYFNDKILKKAKIELEKKTDCKFEYEAIRQGRKVQQIKFTVKSNNKYLTDIEDELPEQLIEETGELWQEALKPLEIDITKEKIEELRSVLVTIPRYVLPQSVACFDNIEIQKYHYIDRKVKEILRRDKEKKINNRYMYLLKILLKDSEI